MDRFAQWMVRYRRFVGAALVAVSLAAAGGLTRLRFDDKLRGVLAADDPDFAYLESVLKDFGSDDNDIVFLIRTGDIFTPDAIAAIRSLDQQMAAAPGIDRVYSLARVAVFEPGRLPRPVLPRADADADELVDARARALAYPLVAGQLLSSDATTSLMIARIGGGSLSAAEMKPAVDAARDRARETARRDGVEILVTGIPVIRCDIVDIIEHEDFKFGPAGASCGLIIGWLIFRRFAAVAIVLAAAFGGALWAIGGISLAGVKINVLTNVLPTLVLVIGFTDAVHLVFDYRHSRAAGLDRRGAAEGSLRRLAGPCLLTSLTTAIGFGSLATAHSPIIREFGLVMAFGVGVALVAVLAFVPPLCDTRLGDWACSRGGATDDGAGSETGWLARYAVWVTRRARPILWVGVPLTVAATVAAIRLRPNNTLGEAVPERSEARRALAIGDKVFGGLLTIYAVVEWDNSQTFGSDAVTGAIDDVQRAFANEPLTAAPLSALDIARAISPTAAPAPEQLATIVGLLPADVRERFVRPDRRRALVTARVKDTGGMVYAPVFERLQRQFDEIAARQGVSIRLTGTPVVAARNVNLMIDDLASSLGTAAIVIFVVMGFAFRSLRLGLISVIPNLFPLAITGALIWAVGAPLQITSVIVFSICLGIAVDDTIHLMHAYRHNRATGDNAPTALRRGLVRVGPAMMTTTAVFVSGFAVIMLSEMPPLRIFSGLSCFAMVGALAGDLVLLPALLICFPGRAPRAK